jgi:hypothetical protein
MYTKEVNGITYTFFSNPLVRIDEWIIEELKGRLFRGFFVEITAGNGIHDSNTLTLDKLGWTGILVEPDEQLNKQLVQNRPTCTVCQSNGTLPLATILTYTPNPIDLLVLINGAELALLDSYYSSTLPEELRRFKYIAVGWGLNAGKLVRLKDILEPQGYELRQLRGFAACFAAKT